MIEPHSISNPYQWHYGFLFNEPLSDATLNMAETFIGEWAAEKGWALVKQRVREVRGSNMFEVKTWLR